MIGVRARHRDLDRLLLFRCGVPPEIGGSVTPDALSFRIVSVAVELASVAPTGLLRTTWNDLFGSTPE